MLQPDRLFRGCAAALIGLACSVWPISAQQAARKPRADRNYDIREELAAAQLAPPDPARDRALVDRRKAAAAERQGVPIVLNDFGLPKNLFHPLGPMTAPSSRDPESIARDFLAANRELLPPENLRLRSRHAAGGLVFLQFQQTYRGVDVFRGQVNLALNGAGQVVQASAGEVIPDLDLSAVPALTPEEAVERAFQLLDLESPPVWKALPLAQDGRTRFGNPNGEQFTDITAELSIFPLSPTSAVLAYRLFLEVDGTRWYEMLLDAKEGRLLARYNLYRYAAEGRVWKDSPMKGPRELIAFPDGWLPTGGTVTTGNNVDAYLDTDGNNQPDTQVFPNIQTGRAVNATQSFDFEAGDGTTGLNPRNFKAAAVTNLFYFVNLAHDYYYSLGFTEEAGNFQESNFGHGGVAGDSVRAEAQDGSTLDNANFATPPDGMKPRMQIGIDTRGTTATTDDTDNDFDGATVIHEYGHGVSSRLVGGGAGSSCVSGTQSGAMGEGWSDYFAISFFNTPVFSPYPDQNRFRGVRRQSYDNNRLTYEDLGDDDYEVHNDGEVWGGVLWDIRKAVGQAVADKLVMTGLKLTPCNPGMIDARDAILLADQNTNKGANLAALWSVFAKRGMGASASGRDGSDARGTVHNAAYDMPASLQPGSVNPSVTSNPPAAPPALGGKFTYTVRATGGAGPLRYELTQAPDGMTIDPSTGEIQWIAAFVGEAVKVTITDGQGGKVVHIFQLFVDTPLSAGNPLVIGGAELTTGRANLVVRAGSPALQIRLRGGSGDADLTLYRPNGLRYASSSRTGNTETLSVSQPEAGRWRIEVFAYRIYNGLTLTADLPVPTEAPANGVLHDLSGDLSSETFYKISVSAGMASFKVSTEGGTGNLDLRVRAGRIPVCQPSQVQPTLCTFDKASASNGNTESVTFNPVPAGDYYLDLSGTTAYTGVTLTTETTPAAP